MKVFANISSNNTKEVDLLINKYKLGHSVSSCMHPVHIRELYSITIDKRNKTNHLSKPTTQVPKLGIKLILYIRKWFLTSWKKLNIVYDPTEPLDILQKEYIILYMYLIYQKPFFRFQIIIWNNRFKYFP